MDWDPKITMKWIVDIHLIHDQHDLGQGLNGGGNRMKNVLQSIGWLLF